MTEDKETMGQKGLSEWWSEETEYVFQRIERWATFIRGYNRLRSQRWSREASSDEATRFYSLKRSKWKSHPEETKINCCGTFNYQSNSKLESNCLETYRYDHSIYFKTIGDIRGDKKDIIRDLDQDRASISSEELVEWDASSFNDLIADTPISEETLNSNKLNVSDTVVEQEENRAMQNAWPIVDLSKLDLNLMDNRKKDERLPVDRDNHGRDEQENNNSPNDKANKNNGENKSRNYETMKKFPSFKKTSRSSTRRSSIVDENNVVRLEVLLNYNNNNVTSISLQD